MKRICAPVYLALGLSVLLLSGCEDAPFHIDPLNVDGRDGGGSPPSYSALMRVGTVAHQAGDLANAVSIFRRAASIDPHHAAPFVAAGDTLLQMGQVNEAITAYNSALARNARDQQALRGLAKAYLETGRPELANHPLSIAYQDTPSDPKLLQLIGVANDFAGYHRTAQIEYRRGLKLRPGDPALTTNLALSLALTGDFTTAVATLQPLVLSPRATPSERQTLALIYGLEGNRPAAKKLAETDLDPAAVEHNLSFYETLRKLSPVARSRAILSASVERHLPARS